MSEATNALAHHLGIHPESPEQAVLRLLIEFSALGIGAEEGSLLVVDRDQDPVRDLVFAMTVGSHASERTLSGQRVPLGEGVTGLAALTHEVQIGAPGYEGIRQAERGEAPAGQPSAVIAAPMLIGQDLVGVLTAVSFARGKRFNRDHAALYARAAAVAAVVVQQRWRLDDVESAVSASGEEGGRDTLQQQIERTVARLLHSDRTRLAELAELLNALERARSGS